MFKTCFKYLSVPVILGGGYYYYKKRQDELLGDGSDLRVSRIDAEYKSYSPEFNSTIRYLKEHAVTLDGWKLYLKKGGVNCYTKNYGDTGFKQYLGVSTFKGKPDKIAEYITTNELSKRKKFDALICQLDVLKLYEKTGKRHTSYIRYKSPARAFFCDRDFVIAGGWSEEGNVIYNPCVSIEKEEFQKVEKKVVRAKIEKYGWVLEYNKAKDETKVMFLSCCDLSGNLPSWFINLTAATQPLLVCELKKICEKKDGEV